MQTTRLPIPSKITRMRFPRNLRPTIPPLPARPPGRAQRPRGPDNEVFLAIARVGRDHAVFSRLDRQRVGERNRLDERTQFVKAVRAHPVDFKREVDLRVSFDLQRLSLSSR